jgi:predicted NAD/FAD-dependent oxidoreductase
MPVDLLVTYTDGTKELFYVSMNELLGNKPTEDKSMPRTDAAPWPWVNPTYMLKIPKQIAKIRSLEIDPSQRMADVNRSNNTWTSR